MPRTGPRRPLSLLVALPLLAPAMLVGTTNAAAAPPVQEAVGGGPGALSHFDLARKDCVGTARSGTSKVWFTVANGVLSDVYEPTIDTTNVETMQFVVTDGRTFTDLQTRDATYTVAADSTGMACTVTTTAKSGAWQLTSTFVTDPARDTVLVGIALRGLTVPTRSLHLYDRLDQTIGGHGGGGTDNAGADTATTDASTGALVASDPTTSTAASHRDYAVPTSLALRADRPFLSGSNGFVGTSSDGLSQLDALRHLGTPSATATSGNVVSTAELDLRGGKATVALGFGRTPAA
ncbi:MAG: glucan 1,4-alpha-glucosidase, partial [Pseudorhodobacter sp.]|nr:glucan 1,4-alpha-glucosidase [Frankiaceae bacterium]